MIVALDPSGNFKEGFGTTGIAYMWNNGQVLSLDELKAEEFKSPEQYWHAHIKIFENILATNGDLEVVMEGYRLYGHKSKEQTNSQFETPQLIGVIRHWCWLYNIPLKIQYAVEVKNRWKEEILVKNGYLEMKAAGTRAVRYSFKGKDTSTHKRDALKHALHYFRYNRGS